MNQTGDQVMRPKTPPQSFIVLWCLLPGLGCGLGEGAPSGEPSLDPGSPVLHSIPYPVRPGLEVLLTDSIHLVQGKRVGLITNHTGIDRARVHGIDRLMETQGVELVALFSPEHGIRGDETLGGEDIESGVDERTGLPIYSLYGDTRKPTPEMLTDLDVLLFDIQDVGARYYTYISTMGKAMEAAGEAGLPFIVLDRPNPIGGVAVQGNVLDPAFSTFVGLYPIPMRYGLTPGELARLYAGEFGIQVELTVIPMDGWRREMLFSDTGLPWVRPSLNMPSLESALHYPGMCLFDGTNISVGRGTNEAFQVLGAPWIDGEKLAAILEAYALPGVRIQPTRFTPMDPEYGKYTGEEIGGIRLTYLSPEYDPTLTAVVLLKEFRRISGDNWQWRAGGSGFDRLAGTDQLRLGLEAGKSVAELRAGWDQALEAFRILRAPYLIYPDESRPQ